MKMPTDTGFRILLLVTGAVAVSVVWVGLQTGDWTGFVLLVPLVVLIPIVARLPAEPPRRRQQREQAGEPGAAGQRPSAKKDGRRY